MSLTEADILKIAKLSRIKLQAQDVPYYQAELSKILAWVDMLQEVDTNNVPQMTSVNHQNLGLRPDIVTDGNMYEQVLANSPKADYGCFIVPKVVE